MALVNAPRDYVEVENPGELIETLRKEHRGWKRLWNEELAKEAVGAVEGGIHGQWLQYLESQVRSLEEELVMVDGFHQEAINSRPASLAAAPGGDDAEPVSTYSNNSEQSCKPTWCLWRRSSGTLICGRNHWRQSCKPWFNLAPIRRAKADQVPQESGYDYMTVAPAKIVPTIKSPVGKRISAYVLCGNLVRPADHAKPVDAGVQAMVIYDRELMKELEVQRLQIAWNVVPGESPDQTDLYAGGIDSTALRCTLRKLT